MRPKTKGAKRRKVKKTKGIPRFKSKVVGRYDVPALVSKGAARQGHFKLVSKWEVPDGLIQSVTAAGLCRQQFFCCNNISPASWSTGGAGASSDNIFGLDVALGGAAQGHGAPPGLLTQVFNRFLFSMVVGAELSLTLAHTGNIVGGADGIFDFALTPISENELQQIYAGGFTIGPIPGSRISGTLASDQWDYIRSMPGTTTARLSTLNGSPSSVTLTCKRPMSYFNTEPLWQGFAANYCTAKIIPPSTGLTYYLPSGYRNYFMFSQYQSSGIPTGTLTPYISTTVTQTWYAKAWEPVPAEVVL
jgi:hypothetical protein